MKGKFFGFNNCVTQFGPYFSPSNPPNLGFFADFQRNMSHINNLSFNAVVLKQIS